ncbi:MAG: tRNA pseudouridine(38-40) synthase TruA [Eubacteriales bacterium]|nr:tRNA pseudouridine(38-40) synthase TruA [Eubacteriales bacterium]MDD3881557.1 tRNA pseudouridine(38-40) synthase TruA [Eubacteriales bacterium]MDD4513373.1 tRNA pseudouridine(38-40) synthase TruA [Eubacteriales bacterium]
MSRVKLIIEYDGTAYCGWQHQQNGLSVQQVLEGAIEKASGAFSRVTGSSRTDAGVHALCQTAHFDTESTIPPEKWCYVLNTILPPDIRVTKSEQAADDFHARFSARGKRYRYLITNAFSAGAIDYRTHWHVPGKLDINLMKQACADIKGTHDFAAFCAAGGSQKTTIRTVYEAEISQAGNEISFEISGNAFLYNMVRILVGTLVDIGKGRLSPSAIKDAFENTDRRLAGETAPPQGLCLMNVFYE